MFKKSYRLLIGVVIAVTIVVSILNRDQTAQDCKSQELLHSSRWQLGENVSGARIIWQLTEDRQRATSFPGRPNSGLTVSENQVFYRREASHTSCDSASGILLIDILTGEIIHKLPTPPSRFGYSLFLGSSYAEVFRSVKAVPGGYVFISGDHFVFKFDYNGELLWWNNSFPSRSLQSIFTGRDSMYLPTRSTVYALTETGAITNSFDFENVIGFFDDIALIGDLQSSKIRVIDWKRNEEKYVITPVDATMLSTAVQSMVNITDRSGNILLVYNSPFYPTHIDAYELLTGKLAWSLDKELLGVPTIIDERLFVMGSEGLSIYNITDGSLLQQISLNRSDGISNNPNSTRYFWLSGINNIVIMYYLETWDLIALELI